MEPKYITLLRKRQEKGSERSLLSFKETQVDFWSNDYLGLGRNPQLISITGSTGSRLISGNSLEIESVEQQVAAHFGSEAALIFNSGYDANLGLFSSLPQKGDTILYDELVHASVRDGIRLSFASAHSFRHNDTADLRRKLSKASGTVFVAVESLYSMDGDLAPLRDLAELCKEKQALLIVDEAHSGGVFGLEGKGLCAELGIVDSVFLRLFTFGKAYGAHGAAVCCSEEVCHFLINFARSFIYTTALPEGMYRHIPVQLDRSREEAIRKQLQEKIDRFTEAFPPTRSSERSPVQVLEVSDLENCQKLALTLQEAGFAVKAILPPTVPEGAQRIRVCIHAFNTDEELEKLIHVLKKSAVKFV